MQFIAMLAGAAGVVIPTLEVIFAGDIPLQVEVALLVLLLGACIYLGLAIEYWKKECNSQEKDLNSPGNV